MKFVDLLYNAREQYGVCSIERNTLYNRLLTAFGISHIRAQPSLLLIMGDRVAIYWEYPDGSKKATARLRH